MIISIEDLKKQVNCGDTTDDVITAKLEAIEAVIRAFTNNNFQQRAIRFEARSEEYWLYGSPRYFTVGDTVQISASGVNDGLYVVTSVDDEYLEVDRVLMEAEYNLVTKIKYPADVIQCAVDLFAWKQSMGNKVGIKSETISRHSVTYEDGSTLFMGYPLGILNGLKLHKKVRC